MKTVLLTGATGGIGRAIVEELKEFHIAAWYHEQDALQLRAHSVHKCDLAVGGQISAAFKDTLRQYDCIDVLINCAGVVSPSTSFDQEQNIEGMFGVNLIGAVLLSQLVYRQMQQQGYGTIVNIASTAGIYNGRRASISYTSSKTGLLGFTGALADECKSSKIRVCAVSPGTTDTPMLEHVKEYIKMKGKDDPTFVVQSPTLVAKVISEIARNPQKYHGLNIVVEKNNVSEQALIKY